MSDDINIVPRINHLLQVLFLCPFGGNIDPANLQIHKKIGLHSDFRNLSCCKRPHVVLQPLFYQGCHIYISHCGFQKLVYIRCSATLSSHLILVTGTISARFINFVNSGQQRRSAIVLLINFEILGTSGKFDDTLTHIPMKFTI